DDDTRERVLAATVAFDLDVVMTSHELWGTYRSVPQLSIYQLHRENGVVGVHALPFVWDGEVLHELEQDTLLVGSAPTPPSSGSCCRHAPSGRSAGPPVTAGLRRRR